MLSNKHDEDEGLESRVKKTYKKLVSSATFGAIAAGTVLTGGSASLLLAAGFNIGNWLEKRKEKRKVGIADIKSETLTGLITGIMHRRVYRFLRSIPNNSLAGALTRGGYVLAYTLPYVAVTKGLKYITQKYASIRTSEMVKNVVRHPYAAIKETIIKGVLPKYARTVKDTWKNLGLPLVANINLTPPNYQIPVSVALGTGYRVIQGRALKST